jgi:uncharacterized membrane protein
MLSDSSSRTPGSGRPRIASNVAALLTNIPFVGWLIAVVFLVVPPFRKDKFVRFYAIQSILLAVTWVVLFVVLGILGIIVSLSFLFQGLIFFGALMVRLFLMYKAYRHEKVKLPIIGDLAGGNKDRGQQEPADSRQAVREDSSPAQDGLPSIQNASIPGLLVIPPGGIRSKPAPKTQSEPQAGAVLVQIFALILAVLAILGGGSLLMDLLQGGTPYEGEERIGVLLWLIVLVMSLPALVAGLFVWKGSPRLQQLCIITWLVGVSFPIAAYVINNRFQAAEQRADEKWKLEIENRAKEQRPIEKRRYAGPPRRLTDQQKLSLVRELGNLKGHKVKIACDLDNEESTRFATDFVEVFRQAGWVGLDGEDLQLVRAAYAVSAPGVYIFDSEFAGGRQSPDHGAIMFALSNAGLPVYSGSAPGLSLGQVEVWIAPNWLYK